MARHSDAVDTYLETQAARLLSALDSLPDGGTALVIGHGGWIESVVARLVDAASAAKLGGSFWHLDGIRLAISTPTSVVESIQRYAR